MMFLNQLETQLHKLTIKQSMVWVATTNLILVVLAFVLPPDGELRGSAFFSVLGNFHILALHFPAAILVIVPLFEFFDRHEVASPVVRRLSVFSTITTWVAAFCGILHAHFNGFTGEAVEQHLWAGIVASLFAGIATLVLTQGFRIRLATQILAIFIMSFTAHIGGELVHEDGFPFIPNKSARSQTDETSREATISEKRDDYTQIIRPILEAHCVSCHGTKKVKGKLRMDSLEALKKGGSEGPAFVPGDLKKSLLHMRITLEPNDEDFMPPEGEKPLSKEQVIALGLWIEGKPIPDDVAQAALKASKNGKISK